MSKFKKKIKSKYRMEKETTNNKRKSLKLESILESFLFQKISIIYDNFSKVNLRESLGTCFLGLIIVFSKSHSNFFCLFY